MKKTLLPLILWIFVSCDGSQFQNSATRELSRADQLRYQQYMIQGQQLYSTYCSNCHQSDGTGLSNLIPPLAQSDYMLENKFRTFCIIKYGLNKKIKVNGVDYYQPMPANETLSDIEIAQITTYIYNSWEHKLGYIPVKEVSEKIDKCR